MQEFIIEGGHTAKGKIIPQGNKNEALPVLCAAIMCPEPVKIYNIPVIEDISNLYKILEYVGAQVTPINGNWHDIEVSTSSLERSEIPGELASPLRGSITLLAPLLARAGKVFLPRPGGDKIGRRRIDTHLLALEELGAEIQIFNHGYLVTCEKLIGKDILLDEASVTGTENTIMAASIAEGVTTIRNAASEPHVTGLCQFLQSMGVRIDGIGSNVLTVYGIGGYEKLKGTTHHIGPDYLEVGSFISIAAITRGELIIENIRANDLKMIRMVFSNLGIKTELIQEKDRSNLLVPSGQELKIKNDVHGEIYKVDDAPWPMFPADLLSIALVTATQCEGTVLFHEKLFESRLFFVDRLISMGAKIVLCDPHRALVVGPNKLYSSKMSSPDIRAGMSLIIAALAAEGVSVIQNIIQIDRGYEKIDERLQKIGLAIKRVQSK